MASRVDDVIESCPQIRYVHVMTILSAGLFALWGMGELMDARWPPSLQVHWISRAIDTTLLVAALMTCAMMLGVARAHHPLGVLRGLVG